MLGEFIASQRRAAELSLRQLAERTGVSNPYISQIERGLRKPSAEVLGALASALHISASTLFTYAGMDQVAQTSTVDEAIRNDPHLLPSQKIALLEIYRAFVKRDDEPSVHSPEPAFDKEKKS